MSRIDPRLSVPCGEGGHFYCRTDGCPCRCHRETLPAAPPGGTGESGRSIPLELREILRPILTRLVDATTASAPHFHAWHKRRRELIADALEEIDQKLDLP